MKFCNHCGHEFSKEISFCPECGAKIEETNKDAEQKDEQTTQSSTSESAQFTVQGGSRKGISGFIKLLSAFAILLVLALAGGSYAASQMFSPERTVQTFREAVEARDLDKLAAVLKPELTEMTLTRQEIERMVNYLHEHEDKLAQVLESLDKQAADGEEEAGPLTLVEDGRRLLMFSRYAIEVSPYYVTIHTNMEQTELVLDGKRQGTADREDYTAEWGPLWPGEYELAAIYNGEFAKLEKVHTVELFSETYVEVRLTIDAGYLAVETAFEDAELYVNGEATGKAIADLEGAIGPFAFDGQSVLHAEIEFPWGRYKSEEIVLNSEHKDSTVTFAFAEAQSDVREQVMLAVNEFLAGWVPAYENMDINQFTNITEERKSLFATDFQWMLENGQRFTADIVGTEFDLNSFVLEADSGSYAYKAHIDVAYVLDNAAWYYVDEEPQLSEMISFIRYELVYDEAAQQWMISYFTTLDSIDFTNTQAFTYES